MANTTKYDFELCKLICDELANGNNIKKILESSSLYPNWSTFRRWKNEHEELRTLYVNSQQDKGIALEDEIDDVMKSLRDGEMEASVGNVLIQTIKWKMAKFYPKVFGDKVDVTSGGDKIQSAPTAIRIDIVKPNED